MSLRSLSLTSLVVFSLAACVIGGCEAGPGDSATGGSGAGNTGGGTNDGGGTTTFGEDGGAGGGFVSDGGGTNNGGACAGEDHVAMEVPLDMYVMFDKSGSMDDGVKWPAATSALSSFVAQPDAAGIGVGIQYFPQVGNQSCSTSNCFMDADCGTGCGPCIGAIPQFNFPGICQGFANTDSCDPVDYSTAAVEIAALPGNQTPIQNSLNGETPDGSGTPTSAALQGAVDHARAWANFQVGHKVVVVLATDGDPTSCDTDLANINAIAAAGANGTPQILTFVIGVGGSQAALDGFAQAGGTGQAFMIDQDPDVQQAFIDALNAIQGTAIPCAYLIPQPENGEDINFGQINVVYTDSAGNEANMAKVESAAECPDTGLFWYYDDNTSPTQILLCPATCEVVSQPCEGCSVKVVVGCDTIAG